MLYWHRRFRRYVRCKTCLEVVHWDPSTTPCSASLRLWSRDGLRRTAPVPAVLPTKGACSLSDMVISPLHCLAYEHHRGVNTGVGHSFQLCTRMQAPRVARASPERCLNTQHTHTSCAGTHSERRGTYRVRATPLVVGDRRNLSASAHPPISVGMARPTDRRRFFGSVVATWHGDRTDAQCGNAFACIFGCGGPHQVLRTGAAAPAHTPHMA